MTADRATGREGRKLILSLLANAATRIPGAVGILLFLPRARDGLGVRDYAALLAALALGGAATFVFGGLGVAARRMIGTAHGADDPAGQGDAFRSLLVVNLALTLAAGVGVVAWQGWHGASGVLTAVALIPVAGAATNLLDNVRAAYNEHYVTAGVQFLVQTTLYALGIGIAAFARQPLLAGLVIGGGGAIASGIAGALLLRGRPALVRGRVVRVRAVATQAGGAGLADGLVMSGLALAVVLVEARAAPALGAWFATVVRLFQTFLAPVLLVLLPIGSYIRIGWSGRSPAARRRVLAATFAGGAGYGAFVAVAMAVAAGRYAGGAMGLVAPPVPVAAAVFALFGAIVLYKSYTSVAFLVLDMRRLAIGSVAVVPLSAVPVLTMPDAAAALTGYAAITAIGLVLLTADSSWRGGRLS